MKKFLWLALYSAAMAYLESAVVVYLRFLYYPNGFEFPVVPVPYLTAAVELGREFATLVMIFAAAKLAYRKALHQFCAYMFIFGVWDICYYLWLYVFLQWPPGLLTWDILFLLPVPWIGPVLAPVIVSISLITAALIIVREEERGRLIRPTIWHWTIAVLGGLVIILSFTLDFRVVVDQTVPGAFKWGIFIAGEIIGIAVLLHLLLLNRRKAALPEGGA